MSRDQVIGCVRLAQGQIRGRFWGSFFILFFSMSSGIHNVNLQDDPDKEDIFSYVASEVLLFINVNGWIIR